MLFCNLNVAGTMVQSESGTVIVNSEANTLVDSELGTMVINESEDEEDSTMKRKLLFGYKASTFFFCKMADKGMAVVVCSGSEIPDILFGTC